MISKSLVFQHGELRTVCANTDQVGMRAIAASQQTSLEPRRSSARWKAES